MEFIMVQHPGTWLVEKFLNPLNISKSQLAYDLRLPYSRIQEICENRRGITVDTALRLAKYFGTSFESWIYIQAQYEIDNLPLKKKEDIDRIQCHHV
jgi:addiction module antidote protein, HigA family